MFTQCYSMLIWRVYLPCAFSFVERHWYAFFRAESRDSTATKVHCQTSLCLLSRTQSRGWDQMWNTGNDTTDYEHVDHFLTDTVFFAFDAPNYLVNLILLMFSIIITIFSNLTEIDYCIDYYWFLHLSRLVFGVSASADGWHTVWTRNQTGSRVWKRPWKPPAVVPQTQGFLGHQLRKWLSMVPGPLQTS